MSLQAFNAGCNILAIQKDGKNYAMTCAWSSMIDSDKVAMLIGSQSVTGSILCKGDIVGISALSKEQRSIAVYIGENHSSEIDKFADIAHTIDETAILVTGAKVQIKARVRNILHLEGLESDNYVIFDIINYKQDFKKKFLSAFE